MSITRLAQLLLCGLLLAASPTAGTRAPYADHAHAETAPARSAGTLIRGHNRAWERDWERDWENGPPDEASYFPLGVWLQSPANAAAYREIGINVYIGLWQGPTAEQLAALTAAGMPVMAAQNELALSNLANPIIQGWTQQDEPDNAQPDGQGGYGPCVDPSEIIARYHEMKRQDPSRPVLLNLGQGVAWDYDRPYVGRGSACARKWEQYPEYVKGADIVSFDIYPVTSPYEHIQGELWLVARGVDRLREWTSDERPVWNVIETTHVKSERMPTPHQVRAEVWMSLIHGSKGIFYFAHEWYPRFREAALLHYPEMREAVANLNYQIRELAPVLNSPSIEGAVTAESSNSETPVDLLVKYYGDSAYVFAAAMRDNPTEARFTLRDSTCSGPVEVIGENRSVAVDQRQFGDSFGGYEVHLYRLRRGHRLYLPVLDRHR